MAQGSASEVAIQTEQRFCTNSFHPAMDAVQVVRSKSREAVEIVRSKSREVVERISRPQEPTLLDPSSAGYDLETGPQDSGNSGTAVELCVEAKPKDDGVTVEDANAPLETNGMARFFRILCMIVPVLVMLFMIVQGIVQKQ